MSEELKNGSDQKENTIDILVSPKKKEETQKASQSEGQKISQAKPMPGTPPRETRDPARTRTLARVSDRRPTIRSKAQETRVGAPVVQPKKASPARSVSSSAAPKSAFDAFRKTKKEKKPMAPEEKKKVFHSLYNTALIAAIYIACVVLVSALLAYFGINWANDIFALVKDETVAVVTVPENATLSEVAQILKENGLIEYPNIFRMYIGFKNRDSDPPLSFKAGEYELKSTLNYDQIVGLIKDRRSRSIITLTIPEGYTVDEIIDLFLENGIGTKEGFVEAIQEYPYDYEFMDALNRIPLSADRKYRLEGYLFPDTYEFYMDSKEIAVIEKMLTAFEMHFEKAYYERLEELGMDLDEVITLASIIQSEGKFTSDFYKISGVFHNRLKSGRPEFAYLQSDATIQYCLEEHKADLTYEDLEIDHPYNTYKKKGLPPSAIANPGWEAIQAALYPENHQYYYFVSDTDGSTVFAQTLPEHNRNVEKLRKAKQEGTTID